MNSLLKKQSLDFGNQEWGYSSKRVRIWREFVGDGYREPVLVLGLEEFERVTFSGVGMVGTRGDYNGTGWEPGEVGKYKTVFIFETLEHLINPGLCLQRLKEFISEDADIYVSWPSGRPQFLWTAGHFHEFSFDRAEKMFEMCGYRWEKKLKTSVIWMPVRKYFMGIRPILRLVFPLRCRLYHLKQK